MNWEGIEGSEGHNCVWNFQLTVITLRTNEILMNLNDDTNNDDDDDDNVHTALDVAENWCCEFVVVLFCAIMQ